jgi:hypothetical protein
VKNLLDSSSSKEGLVVPAVKRTIDRLQPLNYSEDNVLSKVTNIPPIDYIPITYGCESTYPVISFYLGIV